MHYCYLKVLYKQIRIAQKRVMYISLKKTKKRDEQIFFFFLSGFEYTAVEGNSPVEK